MFTFRCHRGLWEIETSVLKDTPEISHTLGPRVDAVISSEFGSHQPAGVRESLERQEATGSHLGDISTGGRYF